MALIHGWRHGQNASTASTFLALRKRTQCGAPKSLNKMVPGALIAQLESAIAREHVRACSFATQGRTIDDAVVQRYRQAFFY